MNKDTFIYAATALLTAGVFFSYLAPVHAAAALPPTPPGAVLATVTQTTRYSPTIALVTVAGGDRIDSFVLRNNYLFPQNRVFLRTRPHPQLLGWNGRPLRGQSQCPSPRYSPIQAPPCARQASVSREKVLSDGRVWVTVTTTKNFILPPRARQLFQKTQARAFFLRTVGHRDQLLAATAPHRIEVFK